jgi:hypothetical protein
VVGDATSVIGWHFRVPSQADMASTKNPDHQAFAVRAFFPELLSGWESLHTIDHALHLLALEDLRLPEVSNLDWRGFQKFQRRVDTSHCVLYRVSRSNLPPEHIISDLIS